MTGKEPIHVVIVGGGFAGLACARRLAKEDGVTVTLIDKNDYHQFQPLLYQVATSMLAADDIAFPLRRIAQDNDSFETERGEVASIDPRARSVTTTTGQTYQGDYVVLAAGSQPNFFGTPGAHHAFPLYSLDDAEALRTRIIQAFEEADRDPRLADKGVLDFVVVGGGPTGVEVAGALSEMINTTMVAEYPDLAQRAKVHLIDHGHALLGMFADKGHRYAAEVLSRDGVDLRMGIGVTEISPGHATLSDGSTIRTRCVVWGGGLMAAPIAGFSGLSQGRGGRIDVRSDFTIAEFPGILAIGDIANIPARSGKTHPQLGSVALQSGQWAAKTILAGRKDKPTRPFAYLDKGTMAMIGRGAAVAQVRGVELHGKVAFMAWLGVHAALMTGGPNRVDAFKSWAVDFFGKERAPGALDRSRTARMTWGDDDPLDAAAAAGAG